MCGMSPKLGVEYVMNKIKDMPAISKPIRRRRSAVVRCLQTICDVKTKTEMCEHYVRTTANPRWRRLIDEPMPR